MSDINLELAPDLTSETQEAPAGTAAAELSAAADFGAAQTAQQVAQAAELDDSMLTEEEKRQVEEFSKQIDITNSTQVLQYGAGAQQKVASFSEKALENVRSKDLGEVGSMISGVVAELKSFDVDEEEKGLFGRFKKTANKMTAMKAKYAKVDANIDTIVEELEKHQITMMRDVATLDQLYEKNKEYYKELTMYILAGKKKLKEIEEVEIPALTRKAEETGKQEDAQAVSDMTALANRFEKKLHDLELTRIISLQMAPQIRLVQNSDIMMSDKIQSTIVNTIPLWKSQMVIALGVTHAEQAAKAQNEVTELTNQMLKKNAEKLKTATINVAKESERGIVEMETLKYTNEQLINTLDEVLRIQTEGREKRRNAESSLKEIEGELREKLISMRKSATP